MTDSSGPRIGVVVFPGSNCDRDTIHGLTTAGANAVEVWHEDRDLSHLDGVVLPGGFSYGDYLRTGAIAMFSPVMVGIRRMATEGKPVLGICNGFQILLEAGLLPGAMLRNRDLSFVCRHVFVRVESLLSSVSSDLHEGSVLSIPIAHHDGNYYADSDLLDEMQTRGQIILTYCDADGGATSQSAPNGSLRNIAGICSLEGNVVGMMPHPERAAEELLGSDNGLGILKNFIGSCVSSREVASSV